MILFVEKKGTEYFNASVPENGSVAGKPISRDAFKALSKSGFINFKKVEEYSKGQVRKDSVNRDKGR